MNAPTGSRRDGAGTISTLPDDRVIDAVDAVDESGGMVRPARCNVGRAEDRASRRTCGSWFTTTGTWACRTSAPPTAPDSA